MPYIKATNRPKLDNCVAHLMEQLRNNVLPTAVDPYKDAAEEAATGEPKQLSNEEFLSICGDLNYVISRTIAGLMGDVSYAKIAIITGVLEDVKLEFYRRIAAPYERLKTLENGDIPEYKRADAVSRVLLGYLNDIETRE